MNMHIPIGINDKGGNENEYALGLNYEFNPRWKVGLETTGNYTEEKRAVLQYLVDPD
jgi:hypothetical protein